jgi:hypothetical protein
MTEVVKENDLHKQLEEIRLLKSQKYNKKMEVEEKKILEKEPNFDDQKILENKIKKERDDQEIKNKIEDDQIIEHNKYLNQQHELSIKNRIEQTKLLDEHEKIVEELDNVENKIKESKTQVKKVYQLKSIKAYKDNNILDETITNHQPKINSDKPMNHLTILNDSFVIIFSLFDEDNYEEFNTQDFVQSIIDNFYNCITTNKTEIYTFYVSIKEFCTSIDDIDIQLVIFTLELIKMDYHFIDVLNKSNKIEYIRIIFNEFVKIIDELKLFL